MIFFKWLILVFLISFCFCLFPKTNLCLRIICHIESDRLCGYKHHASNSCVRNVIKTRVNWKKRTITRYKYFFVKSVLKKTNLENYQHHTEANIFLTRNLRSAQGVLEYLCGLNWNINIMFLAPRNLNVSVQIWCIQIQSLWAFKFEYILR